MEGRPLEVVHEELNFGIMITTYLKYDKQCVNTAKTANKILGMNRRPFTCNSEEIIIQLYKSLVRPTLEVCIQAWRSNLREVIDLLEKVQTWATRLIYTLHDFPKETRLNRLQLTVLDEKFVWRSHRGI